MVSSCDPLLIYIRELVEANQATKDEIAAIDRQVKTEILAAVEFAVASPYPKPEEAEKIFCFFFYYIYYFFFFFFFFFFCLRANYA